MRRVLFFLIYRKRESDDLRTSGEGTIDLNSLAKLLHPAPDSLLPAAY
jgi:hypothetical protein